MSQNVAIIGATGAVGDEFLRQLAARNYPIRQLKLLASPRSAGKKVRFRDEEITVELLSRESLKGNDVVFLSAGGGVSREWAPIAAELGAVTIDNSSAFRMDPNVPLVIPEINPAAAKAHRGIIAVPNCTTIVTLMAIAPLHREFGLRRMIVSSYQAISGAGAQAMAELEQQARDWSAGKPLTIQAQKHQILFNLYPHIDVFADDGYTKEELKMLHESRKILDLPELKASATCVRVPVLRSHSVAINAEFAKPISPEQARGVLDKADGVEVVDDPGQGKYPMPLTQSGRDAVAVGRIRRDLSGGDSALCLWAVGDQLAKGAALNAVQIAECVMGG